MITSSPATMRSAVVFPQPEGPTNTISSPSGISSERFFTATVPSGYTFLTSENETWAIELAPFASRRSRVSAYAEHPHGGNLYDSVPSVQKMKWHAV